jgi:adenosyl cobinamide kinase/adenosyl cobinamide phosphate guanylyltransferase
MVRNIMILCGPEGAAEFAARIAAEAGDDLGLINTRLDPKSVKASGCRIEEEREYGGHTMAAFDEPLEVGAAIAQLLGHADAVVVDRLDDWAGRLLARHDEEAAIESELTSVDSVLKAQLADIVLLVSPPDGRDDEVARLARRMVERFSALSDVVVDARGGSPRVQRGELAI